MLFECLVLLCSCLPEQGHSVVGRSNSLTAFVSKDTDADGSFLEHSNVVSTVANGGRDWGTTATNTLESMTHQPDHSGLLKGVSFGNRVQSSHSYKGARIPYGEQAENSEKIH